MSSKIEVVSVNISEQTGTVKTPVDEVVLDGRGIVGDAHAGAWHRQVSLLSQDLIDRFSEKHGQAILPGAFGENVTVRGLDATQVKLLDRFRIGDAELELTQIGKECHGSTCAIYDAVGECIMPRTGWFTRVLRGGALRPGDEVTHVAKSLRIRVITLSDRAHAGEYEDRSGPRVAEHLEEFFAGKNWRLSVGSLLLPDDAAALKKEVEQACGAGMDVILTTGSTGVGPRDIAPDVVTAVCRKMIPGVMEHIRLKFGAEKPGALLSRSVAGVAGSTLIYTLPGSVKAVDQYMGEIVKTLEHLLFTVRGIDRHGPTAKAKSPPPNCC